MISEISADIIFRGEKFSPKQAESQTGIQFSEKNEVGDIGVKGAFKGKPIPYGYALLQPPAEIDDAEKIYWLAEKMEDKIDIVRDCGADDIYFYIGYFYEDQCNCELTTKELKAISSLEIPFAFSCYDITED